MFSWFRGGAWPFISHNRSPSNISGLGLHELPTAQNLEVRVVSQDPRIYIIDNFLSSEECQFLIDLVNGTLGPAQVVLETDNKYDTQTTLRNNEQKWLTSKQEEIDVVSHVLKRMHRVARVPDTDAEALQIGSYGIGEKYETHIDSDPPHDVSRPITMLTYLSEPELGGETLFPLKAEGSQACTAVMHEGPDGIASFGIKSCCESEKVPDGMVRVSPRRGRVVLFYSHDLDGRVNPLSEHAACPVRAGKKWIAQRWFRTASYQNILHPPDPRFDGQPDAQLVPSLPSFSRPGWQETRVLSQKAPRVQLIEDFLSHRECAHLIKFGFAQQQLEGSEQLQSSPTRRWLTPEMESTDVVLAAIVKRMHRAARVHEGHAESLQVAQYEPFGAGLVIHIDSDPESGVRRYSTILLYLDGDGDRTAGGETFFPLGRCVDAQDCCSSKWRGGRADGPLLVAPKAGRALFFASHHLDGTLDTASQHGACPVGASGKWIAQRWFHAQNYLDNPAEMPRDPNFDGMGP